VASSQLQKLEEFEFFSTSIREMTWLSACMKKLLKVDVEFNVLV